MSDTDNPQTAEERTAPYGEDPSLRQMAIESIMEGIKARDYVKLGLTPPPDAELLRIAEERYQSSIAKGDDNHLGTAKQNP